MSEFTENDLRQVERDRDLPRDPDPEKPQDGSCPHNTTRLLRVYMERREVCTDCGETLQTVVIPGGEVFCGHDRPAIWCPYCKGEKR